MPPANALQSPEWLNLTGRKPVGIYLQPPGSGSRAEQDCVAVRRDSANGGHLAFDMSVNFVKGAGVLAARIAEVRRSAEPKPTSSRERAHADAFRCIECGGSIAEVLAVFGSLRCHDCRSARP